VQVRPLRGNHVLSGVFTKLFQQVNFGTTGRCEPRPTYLASAAVSNQREPAASDPPGGGLSLSGGADVQDR
jgi:hypothetical protein